MPSRHIPTKNYIVFRTLPPFMENDDGYNKYVLDANIPISLFGIRELKRRFYDFMNMYGHVYMSNVNYMEVKKGRRIDIKKDMKDNLKYFEVIEIDDNEFNEVYDWAKVQYPDKLAQKNDYYVLAAALKIEANFVVTNDWKLYNHISRYIKTKKLHLQALTTPKLLKHMHLLDKSVINCID